MIAIGFHCNKYSKHGREKRNLFAVLIIINALQPITQNWHFIHVQLLNYYFMYNNHLKIPIHSKIVAFIMGIGQTKHLHIERV